MLDWSDDAKLARAVLFVPLQAIEIYIEDSRNEALFTHLLEFIKADIPEIRTVFPLKDKAEVLREAASHDPALKTALYVIDGDLDWVRGSAPPALKWVYRLECYCIENLLFCDQGLTFIYSQIARVTSPVAEAKLDLNAWRCRNRAALAKLFATFATANEVDSGLKTVRTDPGKLCVTCSTTGAATLDADKVRALRRDQLQHAVSKGGKAEVQKIHRRNRARVLSLGEPLNAVSGKDFLLPLIRFHFSANDASTTVTDLCIRLASVGDRSRFAGLATAINDTVNG